LIYAAAARFSLTSNIPAVHDDLKRVAGIYTIGIPDNDMRSYRVVPGRFRRYELGREDEGLKTRD
jgi:hypothetical protein